MGDIKEVTRSTLRDEHHPNGAVDLLDEENLEVTSVDLRAYDRIVVTGGLGFVGRHLVAALIALGKPVTVLDLASRPADRPSGVTFRQSDIRDRDAMTDALRGADLVFHLAGNPSGTVSVDRPRFDFETNAHGTFNLCEAMAASGVGRLVYLSSAMVYGVPRRCPIDEEHPVGPFLPYGASKLAGEHIARAFWHTFGLPVVIGRAFTLYGPGEDPRRAGGEVSQFLRWQLNGRAIAATGDPERKTRDFCHVSDLVAALLLIAVRGGDGDVYNIGSGVETSLRELGEVIGNVTGTRPRLRADETVTDDTYRMVADISKLRALGYRPRVPLPEGVDQLAAWLGDRPELPAIDTVFSPDQRSGRGRCATLPL